ncbi:MAG: hypothetical protein M3441_19075 [Chloroflexota bacterium]|nr:hypothetical protein [Chloroflexota bacterium]
MRAWLLTLILLLSGLLIVGCVACNDGNGDAPNNADNAFSVPQQTVAASQTPTSTRAEIEATKQAFLDNDQAKRDAAKTRVAGNKAPMPTLPPPAPPVPQDTPEPGLRTCGGGDRTFYVTSCWGGKLGNEYVYLNAGVLSDDPLQGAVQVFTITLDGSDISDIPTYPAPQKQGALYIAYIDLPRVLLIAPQKDGSTSMIAYDLQTRQWETNAPCKVYPLSVHADTFKGSRTRHEKQSVGLSTGGSEGFGWLAFSPAPGTTEKGTVLPKPGEDVHYINTEDASDHTASTGDWLQSTDGIGTSLEAKNALEFLKTSGFIVPVPLWDKATGQGKNLKYHVAGFAWVRVAEYDSYSPTSLSFQYWGTANCAGK